MAQLFIDEVIREIQCFNKSDWVFMIMVLGMFNLIFDFIRFKACKKF